jgi:hypothetical protein
MSELKGSGIEEKETVQRLEYADEKSSQEISIVEKTGSASSLPTTEEESIHERPPATARDLVTEVLSLRDDPSANPWTFRTWFVGIGLSVFAA